MGPPAPASMLVPTRRRAIVLGAPRSGARRATATKRCVGWAATHLLGGSALRWPIRSLDDASKPERHPPRVAPSQVAQPRQRPEREDARIAVVTEVEHA